jgi:hypothetical protein
LVVDDCAALAAACAVSDEDGLFCAWVASELVALSLARVDCPVAGAFVPVEGSDSPAANISGVMGVGAAAGDPFDPTAGVLAEFEPADVVSAGAAAAGTAIGTSTAIAAAAAAVSVLSPWSDFDEDFDEFAPSFELVLESVEPDAAWVLSSVCPPEGWL